jgi:malyl-CoA/(S)-citramalyl-CoA lyase
VIREMGDGSGCVMIDGKMQDDATYKQCKVMVNAARLIARRDSDYATACGFSAAELASG